LQPLTARHTRRLPHLTKASEIARVRRAAIALQTPGACGGKNGIGEVRSRPGFYGHVPGKIKLQLYEGFGLIYPQETHSENRGSLDYFSPRSSWEHFGNADWAALCSEFFEHSQSRRLGFTAGITREPRCYHHQPALGKEVQVLSLSEGLRNPKSEFDSRGVRLPPLYATKTAIN